MKFLFILHNFPRRFFTFLYISFIFGYTTIIRLILVEQRVILGHIMAFYNSSKDVI